MLVALLLVGAGASLAGAKYAGYENDAITYGGQKGIGYLSWGGAVDQMDVSGVPVAAKVGPHGGYMTATTKCVVCHSTHRANNNATAVGQINNQYLATSGSCTQCHTTWGTGSANLLVEWAEPGLEEGPHAHHGSCSACHGGGIHGGGSSKYWGFNAYLLGAASDELFEDEIDLQMLRVSEGGNALISDGTTGDDVQDWFVNGTDVNTVIGGSPNTFSSYGANGEWAGQRSLLTGWVCSREECHTQSVFGNVVWGATYSRNATSTSSAKVNMTGHSTAPAALASGSGTGATCGPCHAGSRAGGYGYGLPLTGAGLNGYVPSGNEADVHGCDQCHDMIGRATNSTAFPHGNRNIEIYEWTGGTAGGAPATTTRTSRVIGGGNLWMYQMNRATIVAPTALGNANTMVDPNVTVIENAVGGTVPGQIRDGVCIKCHVPIDPGSVKLAMDATGKTGSVDNWALRIGATGYGHNYAFPGVADTVDLDGANPYSGEDSGFPGTVSTPALGRREAMTFIYLWR
ncbi:MAG: hypothetical protein LBJ07_04205 [Actinomycetes bacterium]|nr:hypothetical protein [Actinomycetes bacterium]